MIYELEEAVVACLDGKQYLKPPISLEHNQQPYTTIRRFRSAPPAMLRRDDRHMKLGTNNEGK